MGENILRVGFTSENLELKLFRVASFFTSLSLTSSLYALMFHSIERFIAVKYPLKYYSCGKARFISSQAFFMEIFKVKKAEYVSCAHKRLVVGG